MNLKPAWIECPYCDEFTCQIHQMHVFECPCPCIDVWCEHDVFPYDDCINTKGEIINTSGEIIKLEGTGNDLA